MQTPGSTLGWARLPFPSSCEGRNEEQQARPPPSKHVQCPNLHGLTKGRKFFIDFQPLLGKEMQFWSGKMFSGWNVPDPV